MNTLNAIIYTHNPVINICNAIISIHNAVISIEFGVITIHNGNLAITIPENKYLNACIYNNIALNLIINQLK